MANNDDLSQEELEARARELARRVMGKPAEKQEWPGKPKPLPTDPSQVQEILHDSR